MKFKLSLLLLVVGGTLSHAAGITFTKGTLSELLAKAKQENKLLFIDCYTTWCGPCKWMEKIVFPNDTVGKFYNDHFVCASFDMEKGEGIEMVKQYDVHCYPTYLFINGKGELVHRQSSAYPVSKFVELGENALLPEKQYGTLQTKYSTGTIAPSEIIQYMAMRKATCLSTDVELETYIKTQSEADYIKRENWFVLQTYVADPHNTMFRYLLTHRAPFEERYTTDSVQYVMERVYANAMGKCLYAKEPDTTAYQKLRKEVINLKLPFSEKLALGSDMSLYAVTKQWDEYAKVSATYIAAYADSDWSFLNNVAWTFYEHLEDPVNLDKAIAWSKKSVELNTNYYNTDTYAALLYKRGKKSEAETAAKQAIALAEKEGMDSTPTKDLLKKIQAMKPNK